jgi:uncharacterized membrane protein YdjX (TVP38/TMEM64 family)
MVRKVGLAAVYIGLAMIIYLYGDLILDWFRSSNHVLIVVAAATIMALFPVIPYPIVGGVIGAAYGPVWGGIVTWAGSTAASLLMFAFVRYGYQDWGVGVLHKYKMTDKVTTEFEKNAFLMLLFARMIPVIPSIIINVYAALSRVSFVVYAIASSIGKMPAMLLFAVVGDNIVSEPRNIVLTIVIYGVFMGLALYSYRLWGKRRILKGT